MNVAGPDPPRGPGPAFFRRRLFVAGVVVFVVVAGGFIATWAVQRYVTFPNPPPGSANPAARAAAGGRVIWLDADGDRVESWLLPATRAARGSLIIYAHGNGELIDMRAADFGAAREAGYDVLQVEYPGYGRSEGSPSEESLTAALVAAYDWARSSGYGEGRIAGYGRSLGGGAIAQLAARRPLSALVLESTIVSLGDMIMEYGVPRPLLLNRFDTGAVLRSYPGPVLVLHGTADRVFPSANAAALAAAAKRAELHLEKCGHADCPPQWELVLGFLARNGV